MTRIIHPVAGVLAIFTIATARLSSAPTELFASKAVVIAVKIAISLGFLSLIPALAEGASRGV